GFGIPYQIASHNKSNQLEDADVLHNIELFSGDVILVGSDGLWDNLFLNEISAILTEQLNGCVKNPSNPFPVTKRVPTFVKQGKLTNHIMYQALNNSFDKNKTTPWSNSMTQEVEMVFSGGKPDDITCIVVFIH
ncbi:hypothetical protein RFI_11226, partial [Reticulomyxa filosa]